MILQFVESAEILDIVLGWKACIESAQICGVDDLLPSYSSLTIFYDPLVLSFEQLKSAVANLGDIEFKSRNSKLHKIPVCYELEFAPDLIELAEALGLSTDEVIALHVGRSYQVVAIGFSPGFGFLKGLDERLVFPRKKTPRVKVPSGSVGIANAQTGVYPSESAGGWSLIGRTPLVMVDYTSEKISRLSVGDAVTFHQISAAEFQSYEC